MFNHFMFRCFPTSLYYQDQRPFTLVNKRIRSSLFSKTMWSTGSKMPRSLPGKDISYRDIRSCSFLEETNPRRGYVSEMPGVLPSAEVLSAPLSAFEPFFTSAGTFEPQSNLLPINHHLRVIYGKGVLFEPFFSFYDFSKISVGIHLILFIRVKNKLQNPHLNIANI